MFINDPLVEYLMPLRSLARSFEPLDTQRLMLVDKARLQPFAQAIARRVKTGDVVVDIGTGTGVLAMLAARAGAKKVYAIEVSSMADMAKKVIAQNGLQDRVEVIEASSFDIKLPELADVLISETMGHLGIDEGIVATLADARRRLLKKDARLIPEQIDIFAAPSTDDVVRQREVASWSEQIAGLDFSAIGQQALKRSYLRRVVDSELLAAPKCIAHINLRRDSAAPKTLGADFTINKPGTMQAICAWFKADLGAGITLSSRNTSSWFPLHFPLTENAEWQVMQKFNFSLHAEGDDGQGRWRRQIEKIQD